MVGRVRRSAGDTESQCGEVVGCGANGRQHGYRTELLVGVSKVPKLRRRGLADFSEKHSRQQPEHVGNPREMPQVFAALDEADERPRQAA
jgi:hypothetical protein